MQEIHRNRQFIVFKTDDGFVLQNINMHGFAHTHLHSYHICLKLIDLSLKHKLPHDLPMYLTESLKRVNDDEYYVTKIDNLLNNKRRKDYYFNSNKGVKL